MMLSSAPCAGIAGLTSCRAMLPMRRCGTLSHTTRVALQRCAIRLQARASASQQPDAACGASSSGSSLQLAALRAGLLLPAAAQLAVALPALADDPGPAAGAMSGAMANAAEGAAAVPVAGPLIRFTDALPDDPVVTVLFYVAIAILSVVTLGVAYLALTSWLDERKEKEDREKFEASLTSKAVAKDREKAAAGRKVPRRKSSGSEKGGKGFS